MKNNKLFIALVAFVALTLGFMVHLARNYDQSIANINPLEFSLPDVSGQEQALAQWHGKIVVINFWATWCAPCLEEIPEFIKLQNELGGQGLQFVGIAIDEVKSVIDFVQAMAINYPVLIGGDTGMRMSQKLGNLVGAIPFTVIVDRSGLVIHRQMGELSEDKLKEIVTPLLKQP